MKHNHQFKIITFVLLAAYVLSACAGVPAATSVGGGKALPNPVTYLGVIEGISGDQWTINGVTVTVTADIVRDGPFAVGDQVKVEATVNADGSLLILRVEVPSAADLSQLPQLSNDNDDNDNDDNDNDDNVNDDNANDDNINDDNANDDNDNDDNANDNLNDNNANDDDDGNDNDDDDHNDNDDDDHNDNDDDDKNDND